jgi:hypothetical protein
VIGRLFARIQRGEIRDGGEILDLEWGWDEMEKVATAVLGIVNRSRS